MTTLLQKLATEATIRKRRLALVQSGDEFLRLNGKKINLLEIGRMREVTTEILASDTFVNPLEKLLNKEEYARVNDESKMRYILELSAIFVYLKNTTK